MNSAATFQDLYSRHYEGVRRTVRPLCASDAVSHEVTQDAFLAYWHHREALVDCGRVDAWIRTVAKRKAIDLLRRQRSARAYVGEKARDPVPAVPAREVDPPLESSLRSALAALPREQREVFTLRVGEGYTFREIAERVGLGQPAIKSRYRLARKRLCRALGQVGIDAGLAFAS